VRQVIRTSIPPVQGDDSDSDNNFSGIGAKRRRFNDDQFGGIRASNKRASLDMTRVCCWFKWS